MDADDLNTDIRANMRAMRGLDGTSEFVDGILMSGTGTSAWHRPPLLTQAQVTALTGTLQGRWVVNSSKGEAEYYGTAWEEVITVPGTAAQGNIVYRSGTAWERLTAGTSGQFLKTQGAGANPLWATLPAPALTSGAYTGDSTVNRAIAHSLGAIPKLVFIMRGASSYGWYREMSGVAAISYKYNGANDALAVTAPDATNFYVGNATSYFYSANDNNVYNWVAIA